MPMAIVSLSVEMEDPGYNGKTWVDVEEKGKPSKWVTLRALRVIQARVEAAR